MASRCRLCAKETKEEDIAVDVINDKTNLSAKIYHLCEIKIDADDSLPTVACWECIDFLEKAWDFRETVQRVQEELWITLEIATTDNNSCKSNNETEFIVKANGTIKRSAAHAEKSTAIAFAHNDDDDDDDDDIETKDEFLLKCTDDGAWQRDNKLDGWERYTWNCADCEHSFTTANELRDHHSAEHAQSPKYACADCPKLYTKYSTFVAHVRSHRAHLGYTCDLCGKWFRTTCAQDHHRRTHKDEKPHACTTCGKQFRVHSTLVIHARSHLPPAEKNHHQCDVCPKRFGTKPNLMAHKRIHAGIRDFTCDQCGKSFVQKGNLDNHILTHTVTRPFTCAVCGKSFKTSIRLRKHNTVHSGLKPHQCDVCGRQFRERGTLKEHHRIHTGAMPFTCEYCGKAFRFKGVLTTHRRQHTGERPYSCLECQHHFTNWPNYNKHMKRRHGINTSVTVRKPQTIPPTGMPQRNPPGTVLAPPQSVVFAGLGSAMATPTALIISGVSAGGFGAEGAGTCDRGGAGGGNAAAAAAATSTLTFYPANNLYNIGDEILQ